MHEPVFDRDDPENERVDENRSVRRVGPKDSLSKQADLKKQQASTDFKSLSLTFRLVRCAVVQNSMKTAAMANRIPETVNGFRTSVEYRIATGVPAQRMTVSMVKTTAVRLSGAVGCVLRLLNRSRVRDWAERIARTGPGLLVR